MYSRDEYEQLVSKYGTYSSWAIWDHTNENNLSVIEKHYDQLHSRYIFLGLNISKPLQNSAWKNFHGGRHDRKLKYACNDTVLRGSYLTDIFKGIPQVSSRLFEKQLTQEVIRKNVDTFNQEMKDVKINSKSIFVLLGALVARCFDSYFRQSFDNAVIMHTHHSYYGVTDEKWVTGLWEKLGISKDYSQIKGIYT